MNITKSLFCLVLSVLFLPLAAQTEDYYTAPVPENAEGNYLFNKPDSGFAAALKFNRRINKDAFAPAIVNYGQRVALYTNDKFTIETDRSLSIYFKAKNGKREIFLKYYLTESPCWTEGAVAYFVPDEADKKYLNLIIAHTTGETITQGKQTITCGQKVMQINIEEAYANSTGTQPPTFIEKVAENVSVVDDKKALLILLPREHLSRLVSVNFWLYDKRGRQVKEFLNMRAAENVLYINDLPKGTYKYKVEVHDGTLIKKGEVTLKK